MPLNRKSRSKKGFNRFKLSTYICVDCGNPVSVHRVIKSFGRCVSCEWIFLTVLDPDRLAKAVSNLKKANA
jgi:ribosomal protein L37AE/L43A